MVALALALVAVVARVAALALVAVVAAIDHGRGYGHDDG